MWSPGPRNLWKSLSRTWRDFWGCLGAGLHDPSGIAQVIPCFCVFENLSMILALCFGVLGVGKAWEYGEGIILLLKSNYLP